MKSGTWLTQAVYGRTGTLRTAVAFTTAVMSSLQKACCRSGWQVHSWGAAGLVNHSSFHLWIEPSLGSTQAPSLPGRQQARLSDVASLKPFCVCVCMHMLCYTSLKKIFRCVQGVNRRVVFWVSQINFKSNIKMAYSAHTNKRCSRE